jgi:hypothetical protein
MAWWKKDRPRQGGAPESRTKDDADLDQPTVVVDGNEIGLDGLFLGTRSETLHRAEAAMPGTASISPILALVPPPVDPDLARARAVDEARDYGPDPIAEYSLAFPTPGVFVVGHLSSAITPELRRYFALPTLYVRTPSGRITYMQSSDAPKEATGIIAGWTLREAGEHAVEQIYTGAQGLAGWLATRPEGFAATTPDRATIAAQHRAAQSIIAIEPNDVAIVAWPKEPASSLDGKTVWRILHALGLAWGDMDQFQWSDPTSQTDYLFWAEVDDGQLGYALPEEIAAGRQHFRTVRFVFNIARTPHPAHVLAQMTRAADALARELDCQLTAVVDRTPADGLRALEAAVDDVVRRLEACGVKPGADSVCRLR